MNEAISPRIANVYRGSGGVVRIPKVRSSRYNDHHAISNRAIDDASPLTHESLFCAGTDEPFMRGSICVRT